MFHNRRVQAFSGPDGERRAEIVGKWFQALIGNTQAREWCVSNGVGLTKATGESTNTIGGFLAPVDFDNAIIAVREQVGAFRNAEVRPTTSDSQVRPRWFGGLVASFVVEGSSIPESSFQLSAVGSNLKKVGVLARSSSELWEDSAADLARFITTEVAYALAGLEDDCGFNGDGTSKFSGIQGLGTALLSTYKSYVAAASGHHTFLTIDSADIGNLMGAVLGSALPGAAFYCSVVAYGQTFARLAGSSGALTSNLLPDGTLQVNYMGFPVRFSAKLPDGSSSLTGLPMIYFGNLKQSSLIVERKDPIVLAISRDRLLDQDQVYVRAIQRMDLINHDVGSATDRGPVAVLIGTT